MELYFEECHDLITLVIINELYYYDGCYASLIPEATSRYFT